MKHYITNLSLRANTQISCILTKIRAPIYTPPYTELEIKIRSLKYGCPFAQGDLAWTVITSVFEMRHILNRKLNVKVVTLQRKISIPDEEIFIDICSCGFKEGDEQSMAVRECGASNGRVQGFPVGKTSGSRKKKRFRKNKISPAEKIAREECDEENAKKSHAPLMFTSVRDLQRLQI